VRFDYYIYQGIVNPFFEQHTRVRKALFGCFNIGRRKIKKNFTHQAAHSRFFCRARCFILKNIHIFKCSGAGFYHFGARKHRAPVGKMFIYVFRFRGENIIIKPVHQFQIVGNTAETGHCRVCVAIYEARHNQRILRVDCFWSAVLLFYVLAVTNGNDIIVVNNYGRVFQVSVLLVHEQDFPARDD